MEQATTKDLSNCKDFAIQYKGEKRIAAPLLYKTIMHLAANTQTIDVKFALTCKLWSSKTDKIDKSYTCFDQNFTQLCSHGQSVSKVHSIVLDAYFSIPDANFHQYIKNLYGGWMDAVCETNNIQVEHLMQQVRAKFNLLVSLGM